MAKVNLQGLLAYKVTVREDSSYGENKSCSSALHQQPVEKDWFLGSTCAQESAHQKSCVSQSSACAHCSLTPCGNMRKQVIECYTLVVLSSSVAG